MVEVRQLITAGNYPKASRLLRSLPASPEQQLLARLSRNMASLAKNRPELVSLLGDPCDTQYAKPVIGPGGHPTLVLQTSQGLEPLAPNADPMANLKKIAPEIDKLGDQRPPIGLAGFGDGYTMQYLAQMPAGLLGMQQAVLLVEPDLPLLRAALHVLDHSGPQGTIAQQRFYWFIGPTWKEQLERAMLGDMWMPMPVTWISHHPARPEIAPAYRQLSEQIKEQRKTWSELYQSKLDSPARLPLTQLLEPHPPRVGRVMLITSRFTTVLQYATTEIERAFQELGWQTSKLIESNEHARINRRVFSRELLEFDPDLVFQIDHHRKPSELVPEGVPFVCWIQDQLAHLTSSEAGRRLGTNDFTVVGNPKLYTEDYAYPSERTFHLPKLANIPSAGVKALPDVPGHDFLYVSNWSQLPENHLQTVIEEIQEPLCKKLLEAAGHALIQTYAKGQTAKTYGQVRQHLNQAGLELNLTIKPSVRNQLTRKLMDRFNTLLYRQQSLSIVAKVAEQRGMSLAIYGKGWDQHPTFAPYAKGYADYGDHLEALTRQARFCLQLEPMMCLAHQRVLDGLACGGFFLFRDNPFHHVWQAIAKLLHQHNIPTGTLDGEVKALLKHSHASEALTQWDQHMQWWREHAEWDPAPDLLPMVDMAVESGLLVPQEPTALPRLNQVIFDDVESLTRCVERLDQSSDLRESLRKQQQQRVISTFSYRRGVEQMLTNMHRSLIQSQGQRQSAA